VTSWIKLELSSSRPQGTEIDRRRRQTGSRPPLSLNAARRGRMNLNDSSDPSFAFHLSSYT